MVHKERGDFVKSEYFTNPTLYESQFREKVGHRLIKIKWRVLINVNIQANKQILSPELPKGCYSYGYSSDTFFAGAQVTRCRK